jgi:surface antigen
MKVHKTAAAALALSLALAACETKQDTGAVVGAVTGGVIGHQFGKGKGNVAATALGVVVGGIVGSEIGRSLDERDRMYAQQAELAALERGRAGERTPWRNPDSGRYGEIVPGPAFRRGPQDCREYTHTVFIEGRPRVMRGVACRNPDGTWSAVG